MCRVPPKLFVALVGVCAIANSLPITLMAQTEQVKAGDSLDLLSVEKLMALLKDAPRSLWEQKKANRPSYETILSELVRRGGSDAEQALTKSIDYDARELADLLDAREQTGRALLDERYERMDRLQQNLEALTALRRIQNKPDPIQVVVDLSEDLRAGTRKLPELSVALENRDTETTPVSLKDVSYEGSERPCHWLVHVWTENGELLKVRRVTSSGFQGSDTLLDFGKKLEIKIVLDAYVDIRRPGKYKVQVFYHNVERIDHLREGETLDNLVLCKSEPFELNVEHGPTIRIMADPEITERTRSLIEQLDERRPIRIVQGEYTENFHEFIKPKSPPGQLLTLGWPAVPTMIEAVLNEDVPYRKRAWLLGLLYSITGERDLNPMPHKGVLPGFDCRRENGFSGQESTEYTGDRDAQIAFAKRWLEFRDNYIEIEQEK